MIYQYQKSPSFILASNRLPLKFEDGELVASDGGLSTALKSASLEDKALWIGTLGPDTPEDVRQKLPSCYRHVEFDSKTYKEYYNGYSNSVLWPGFHDRPDLIQFDESYWKSYWTVNKAYAQTIVEETPESLPVWVHDYHLMLVPFLIKRLQPKRKVSFFLHIPWPQPEIALQIPHMDSLVRALAYTDAFCAHDSCYLENLKNCAAELNCDVPEMDMACPIGIDWKRFAVSKSEAASNFNWKDKPAVWSGFNIVGVDRLDYSKGLKNKLEVFSEFLELNPKWHEKVTLRQLVIPSRIEVDAYGRYKEELLNLAEHVNMKFGRGAWKPVDLFVGRTPQDNLKKIYRNGDCCWVNSFKDGMNLVALEYIAAQDPDNPGLLMLSNKAGCCNYLQGPLTFNSRSPIHTYRCLHQALSMQAEEKRERFRKAIGWIKENSVQNWVTKNLALLLPERSFDKSVYGFSEEIAASQTVL